MIFEIIAEILLEGYMELMLLIVPNKNLKKWQIVLARILAVFAIVLVFALVILGLTLILDCGNAVGYIPIAIAAIISIVQIVFGIVLYNRNHAD